eukprot:Awhi_evm1s3465
MKAEIDITTHSDTEIEAVLKDFGFEGLLATKKLFGGYSGTSYIVTCKDDK